MACAAYPWPPIDIVRCGAQSGVAFPTRGDPSDQKFWPRAANAYQGPAGLSRLLDFFSPHVRCAKDHTFDHVAECLARGSEMGKGAVIAHAAAAGTRYLPAGLQPINLGREVGENSDVTLSH